MNAATFHQQVRAQLARLDLKPAGKTYDHTIGAVTAVIDTVLDKLTPKPAPVQAPPETVAPPPAKPPRGKRARKTPPPATPAPAPSYDWRPALGYAPGAKPTIIQLKAAYAAHLNEPGVEFAYKMAKVELGYQFV